MYTQLNNLSLHDVLPFYRHYIVVAALKSLAEEGKLPVTKVAEAIAKYGIQADKINPLYA